MDTDTGTNADAGATDWGVGTDAGSGWLNVVPSRLGVNSRRGDSSTEGKPGLNMDEHTNSNFL
jgi:hypothetical protein